MRRPPPDPSRVHAVTLALWLSGVVGLALLWTFPRFFGAIALMILGVAAYGVLYAFIEARMAAGDFADSLDDEPDPLEAAPPPRAPRRPRQKRAPAVDPAAPPAVPPVVVAPPPAAPTKPA